MLAWHATDEELFLNTSLYGNLLLQKTTATTPFDVIGCPYKMTNNLTEKIDSSWSHIPAHSLNSWVYGNRVPPENFAAQFRTYWNEEAIFFLFEVQDDKNVFSGNHLNGRDYGWIENASGNTVWQLQDSAQYNGGSRKNRVVDTVISLGSGNYLARYSTDESHSPENWDASAPNNSFYGISIEEVKATKQQQPFKK